MSSERSTVPEEGAFPPGWRAGMYLAALVLGYVGIYICRKNFSVAIPLIREEFGVSKEAIGELASVSTLAYMVGKVAFGPIIDRLGGRACFLVSLVLVAAFCGGGAFVSSLGGLTVMYSLNRLAGAGGWGSMVKLVPDWFAERSRPFAFAVLSLSFVFGGVVATVLAGWIVGASQGSWRWVMGGPAVVLALVMVGCILVLPKPTHEAPATLASEGTAESKGRFQWSQVRELFRSRQFWVVCSLSFTLTLLRETFNTWTVDFFATEGGADVSHRIAAFLSTPFDACGAVGILLLGWLFGRVGPAGRRAWLFVILSALGALLYGLPSLARQGLWSATFAVGLVGFLTYGPYSLLAGVLSLEIRGRGYVATVAGLVDAAGYLAAVLAGAQFGKLLDRGGYALAFPSLALLAFVSAVLCLFLYPAPGQTAVAVGNPTRPE